MSSDRRAFLKSSVAAAGLLSAAAGGSAVRGPRIRFAVIGVNHPHVHRQIEAVVRGGGELVSFFAKEPDLAEAFGKRYPKARLTRSEKEILESDVALVASAG